MITLSQELFGCALFVSFGAGLFVGFLLALKLDKKAPSLKLSVPSITPDYEEKFRERQMAKHLKTVAEMNQALYPHVEPEEAPPLQVVREDTDELRANDSKANRRPKHNQ